MASTKILIVDDEQDVIDLLSLHLRKAGYALSTATDGAAGLRSRLGIDQFGLDQLPERRFDRAPGDEVHPSAQKLLESFRQGHKTEAD